MNPQAAVKELLGIPRYHRRLHELPGDVSWQRLPYGPHRRQYLIGAEQADPYAPVAVWFHGGGWQFGSPEKLSAFGSYFWQRGYSVYMPSHRRVPGFSGSRIVDDVWAALDLIQRRTSLPRHFLLAGMSSGGHLATLATLRQREWLQAGSVEGLLACGAPLSLKHLGASPTRRRFAGRLSTDHALQLDPARLLDSGLENSASLLRTPTCIIHGTNDGLVPWRSAVAFCSVARKLGWQNFTFQSMPGGTHLDAARWVWPAS